MLFISACFLTGEFPPRIQSLKAQYESFTQLKKTYSLIMKNAAERLQKAEAQPQVGAPQSAASDTVSHEANRNLQQEIREMRVEQLRLQSQVETLVQQNRELIRILMIPHPTN